MKIKSFNKASAAVVGGALSTLLGAFFNMTPELQGAVATLVTTLCVLVAPKNQETTP